jgi:acetyltransferase-like isoleucine patch superfamily enzyme
MANASSTQKLDESKFIRHLMYEKDLPRWQRYAALVIGAPSRSALASYELRTGLFGSMPGALGIYLRQKFYRKLFRKVGRNLVIGRDVTIRHADKIVLGDDVVLDDRCVLDGRGAGNDGVTIGSNTMVGHSTIIQSKAGAIHIGSNVNIGSNTAITAQGGIVIHDWVQIAGGCKISGGRYKLDPEMRSGGPLLRQTTGPIVIGRGSFLGPGAIVNDAANIGQFSTVGPGAIVMSDIPEYGVYMARPGMLMGSTVSANTAQ